MVGVVSGVVDSTTCSVVAVGSTASVDVLVSSSLEQAAKMSAEAMVRAMRGERTPAS